MHCASGPKDAAGRLKCRPLARWGMVDPDAAVHARHKVQQLQHPHWVALTCSLASSAAMRPCSCVACCCSSLEDSISFSASSAAACCCDDPSCCCTCLSSPSSLCTLLCALASCCCSCSTCCCWLCSTCRRCSPSAASRLSLAVSSAWLDCRAVAACCAAVSCCCRSATCAWLLLAWLSADASFSCTS